MDPVFFRAADEFAGWLEQRHADAGEIWVGFYRTQASEKGITYSEAVDQALRYGWIDAVRQSIDDDRWAIRFTPRKTHSTWSAVNIKRVEELRRLGLMRPAGLKAFEEREQEKTGQYSYERRGGLDDESQKRFQANPKAWAFFLAQPPSYRRVVTGWVMSARREDTRGQRLAELIDGSERGDRLDPYKAAA